MADHTRHRYGPRGFLGRGRELRALHADIGRAGLDTLSGHPPPYARVLLVAGRPGAGRTALAEEFVSRVVAQYPGGVLRATLTDPCAGPVAPGAAARRLLSDAGVAAPPPGASADELTEALRAHCAARPTVLLLDDVAEPEQVLELLPESRRCLVVAVAGRPLTGVPDVRPCAVGGLDRTAAVRVLARHAGATPRVTVDPRGAEALAQECGDLPAALLLLGGWLRAHPKASVADAYHHLTAAPYGDGPGLREAQPDPLDRAWRLVRSALTPRALRLAPLLTLAPGAAVDVQGAAALAGCDAPAAEGALVELQAFGLLRQRDDGWFVLPGCLVPVLRAELAAVQRPSQVLLAAARMWERTVRRLVACRAVAEPAGSSVRRRASGLPAGLRFASVSAARAWLTAHRAWLLAAAQLAADAADPGTEGPPFLPRPTPERQDDAPAADASAAPAGGTDAELPGAPAEFAAGAEPADGTPTAAEAADIARTAAAPAATSPGQLDNLARRLTTALGRALDRHLPPEEAAGDLYRLAELLLSLAERLGLHRERAAALLALADQDTAHARYARARERYRAALDAARSGRDSATVGVALESLGGCYAEADDWSRAADWYARALAHRQSCGEHAEVAALHTRIAAAHTRTERFDEALREWRAAAAGFRRLRQPAAQVRALDEAAALQTALGRPQDAVRTCRAGLRAVRGAEEPRLTGELLLRLAAACRALDDTESARGHEAAAARLLGTGPATSPPARVPTPTREPSGRRDATASEGTADVASPGARVPETPDTAHDARPEAGEPQNAAEPPTALRASTAAEPEASPAPTTACEAPTEPPPEGANLPSISGTRPEPEDAPHCAAEPSDGVAPSAAVTKSPVSRGCSPGEDEQAAVAGRAAEAAAADEPEDSSRLQGEGDEVAAGFGGPADRAT